MTRENNLKNMSKPSEDTRRGSIRLMMDLIGLVAPLKLQMIGAILLGVVGFLLSFGLGILGGYALINVLPIPVDGLENIPFGGHNFYWYIKALIVCAVLRGVLHYLEQFLNHYIAFSILAQIRHRVFKAMRRLAPAKLEGENQGKLISIIMGDIELLEVFYAHTISPILIALLTFILLFVFLANINIYIALLAAVSHLVVGLVIPVIASEKSKTVGVKLRRELGLLNGKFLDQLRGIREVIQYDKGQLAVDELADTTEKILKNQEDLRMQVAGLQSNTDTVIIVFSVLQALMCIYLVSKGIIRPTEAFIGVLTQISTFAPFIALANLGVTLTQTFACGDRVLNLLEESPIVEKNVDGEKVEMSSMSLKDVYFKYDDMDILKGVNLELRPGETIGVMGKSGSGKSTILKLMMRFWDPQKGSISINGIDIKKINTDSLYDNIDYMTQSTILFAGDIRDNMKVAKQDATDEEIYEALKKASIYEHISKLEKGLDTRVSDLGDNFSGGERQRLGLARCFLTDSKLLLLDEPTSNLDSHNEAVILKSLKEGMNSKTLVLVSHRESTLGICDRIYICENGELKIK